MKRTGMRPLGRSTGLGLVLLSLLLLNGPAIVRAADAEKDPHPEQSVRKIHDQINRHRNSKGLKPLQLDPFISQIAAGHSRDMAAGKVDVGHKGFENRAKAIQEKMRYRSIAENVGATAGHPKPEEEVVRGWLKSPGHLKNIQGDFEITGIGVAKKGKDHFYFTQIFMKKAE